MPVQIPTWAREWQIQNPGQPFPPEWGLGQGGGGTIAPGSSMPPPPGNYDIPQWFQGEAPTPTPTPSPTPWYEPAPSPTPTPDYGSIQYGRAGGPPSPPMQGPPPDYGSIQYVQGPNALPPANLMLPEPGSFDPGMGSGPPTPYDFYGRTYPVDDYQRLLGNLPPPTGTISQVFPTVQENYYSPPDYSSIQFGLGPNVGNTPPPSPSFTPTNTYTPPEPITTDAIPPGATGFSPTDTYTQTGQQPNAGGTDIAGFGGDTSIGGNNFYYDPSNGSTYVYDANWNYLSTMTGTPPPQGQQTAPSSAPTSTQGNGSTRGNAPPTAGFQPGQPTVPQGGFPTFSPAPYGYDPQGNALAAPYGSGGNSWNYTSQGPLIPHPGADITAGGSAIMFGRNPASSAPPSDANVHSSYSPGFWAPQMGAPPGWVLHMISRGVKPDNNGLFWQNAPGATPFQGYGGGSTDVGSGAPGRAAGGTGLGGAAAIKGR